MTQQYGPTKDRRPGLKTAARITKMHTGHRVSLAVIQAECMAEEEQLRAHARLAHPSRASAQGDVTCQAWISISLESRDLAHATLLSGVMLGSTLRQQL